MATVIGVDFGTTNTVIAVPDAQGTIATARFAVGDGIAATFRSILCFWTELQGGSARLRHAGGPAAIGAYLDGVHDSRLVMSLKSYLAQKSFVETRMFGHALALPQLIALLLRAAFDAAGLASDSLHVVAGRPVHFVGDAADDDLGAARLRDAFAAAGIEHVQLALEPEAAGYRFTRTLTDPTHVMIGDFGGGTSDFSVLRFQLGAADSVVSLGHAGVGLAGDTFDYRIIDRVISPRLGKGAAYRMFGNDLPVPPEYFTSFARWHRLSLMRTPRVLRDLEDVARMMQDPEQLRGLIRLIDEEKGYELYQAVSAVKAQLSDRETARLQFAQAGLAIDVEISRAEFEGWIAPDLRQIEVAIDRAMAMAGLHHHAIDRVFLTGGTSFVPAVRRLFERRFGPARISTGDEFVSVAEGLALIGQDRR